MLELRGLSSSGEDNGVEWVSVSGRLFLFLVPGACSPTRCLARPHAGTRCGSIGGFRDRFVQGDVVVTRAGRRRYSSTNAQLLLLVVTMSEERLERRVEEALGAAK